MPNTEKSNANWNSFWKENPTGFNATMEQSTLFFANNLARQFPIQPTDHILDIGCGPGFLIESLEGKCALIHGTDIAEKYIEICKARFAANPQITFSVSNAYDYELYKQLITEHQITRVILLSVLQYYKNENEVRALITSLKEIAEYQKFSCLLADIIPVKHSTFGDIVNITKHSIKKGYTLKFVKFLAYAAFSDYRKIKKNGLLQIDEALFKNLSRELKFDVKIIKDLTLHSGRYSVLINF